MKRILFVVGLLLAVVALLAACGEDGSAGIPEIDSLISAYEGTTTEVPTSEGNTIEATTTQGEQTPTDPDLTKAEVVSAPLFAIDGQNLSLILPNATESFSFIKQITVSEKATWQISTDIYGINSIPTKTVPLEIGDNTFYLLVTSGDSNNINLYTVKIRRRPIYTVSFDTANGTAIAAQQVEESYLATKPNDPERTAYTFANWQFDFSRPVMGNTIVTAAWNPIDYTITYNFAGGTMTDNPNQTVYTIESDTITFNGLPTKTNYMFAGWDIATLPQGSYGDKTITAQWLTYSQVFTVSGNSITELTDAGKQLTAIEIPSEIDGVAITGIGGNVPLGGNSYITYSDIFRGCSNLKAVYISDLAKWCSISFYDGNSNPLTFAHNLYLNGELVTDLIIPEGVTSIGNSAFSGCSGLTSVTIGNSVTSIGINAFRGCSGLKYNEYDNAYYLGNENNPYLALVSAKDTSITSCSISEQTRVIMNEAFGRCHELKSITIPSSVRQIGAYAFSGCSSLRSIAIPDSVTSIGNYAFNQCFLTNVVIPNSVTFIGENAFYRVRTLTWDAINCIHPIGINTIMDDYFNVDVGGRCDNIVLGTSYLTIPSYLFGLSRCEKITIPSSVVRIEKNAFLAAPSDVDFQGTKAQWNAIEKETNWEGYDKFTIHCTDGDIEL